MRNPKRIPVILAHIKKAWEKNPDLRLCQLIGNCGDGDMYFVEDDEFERRLEEVYGKE